MKIIRLYFLISILLLAISPNHAQKIGYIDYELFLSTLPAVKKVQTDLAALQADYQTKGEKMVEAYQEKVIAFQNLERNSHSPKQLEEKAKKLQLEEQKIKVIEKEMQDTLAIKSKEWMQPIHTKVRQAIRHVAKEQGYLFILNSQESIRNSRFLSYKEEEDNITPLLKAKLE